MNGLPDLNALVDAVAERLLEKLRAEFGHVNDNGAGAVKPRLLSVEQAAAYLCRSEHSVRHLIAAGKVPAVRIPGTRRVFLDIRDLDRIIDSSKEAAVV